MVDTQHGPPILARSNSGGASLKGPGGTSAGRALERRLRRDRDWRLTRQTSLADEDQRSKIPPDDLVPLAVTLSELWGRLNTDQRCWVEAPGALRADDGSLIGPGVALSIGDNLVTCLRVVFPVPTLRALFLPHFRPLMEKEHHPVPYNPESASTAVSIAPDCRTSQVLRTSFLTSVLAQWALEEHYRSLLGRTPNPILETIAHRQAGYLAAAAVHTKCESLGVLASMALVWCHENWCRIYGEAVRPLSYEHPPGMYSLLHLDDLTALAERHSDVVARIGKERIANEFEFQMGLLIQSLGCYVVPSRAFERVVDLTCVAPDPVQETFLVEAKTASGGYSLTADDERALREHVTAARRLRTLPPLRTVLIVGPRPRGTMDAKLSALSASLNICVRYVNVGHLARLRDAVVAPFPLGELLGRLRASSPVVPESLFLDIEARAKTVARAHQELVRSMLAGISDVSAL